MLANTVLGLLLIFVGGVLSGLFAAPFRLIHGAPQQRQGPSVAHATLLLSTGWQWAHYWLICTIYGTVCE